MNQILITGDEVIKERAKKVKKVIPINTLVTFFAIFIIIFGICMITGSVYAKAKINEAVEANTKPLINLIKDDDNNTVEINVSHIRGIKTVTYKWNDEEEIKIDGKNKKNISKTIDLIGGENILKVSVTEENGQTINYEKRYTVGNIPEINLEAVSNGVKIIVTSEEKIDYIQYNWDDGEMQKIEVGEKGYEGIINAPNGKHILEIEVIDINQMKATKEQAIIGDTEPTVSVEPDLVDGKVAFIIDAEDDEKITKVEITHNGGEKTIIDVNKKTYHNEIIMTEGNTNTIIVKVTNVNGLSKTSRVKFDNK